MPKWIQLRNSSNLSFFIHIQYKKCVDLSNFFFFGTFSRYCTIHSFTTGCLFMYWIKVCSGIILVLKSNTILYYNWELSDRMGAPLNKWNHSGRIHLPIVWYDYFLLFWPQINTFMYIVHIRRRNKTTRSTIYVQNIKSYNSFLLLLFMSSP